MPKGLLQEKFQITAERRPRESREWASFESQRHVHDNPTQHYKASEEKRAHARELWGPPIASFDAPKTNDMPPGMFIDNQNPTVNDHTMKYTAAGETDPTNHVTSGLKKGYTHLPMKGTDDLYTNEHTEEFYGEATVDGVTGFLERNNYLDRN